MMLMMSVMMGRSLLTLSTFPFFQARLSNVVEADPDVAAAMDILSFALYHENNKVVGEEDSNDATVGQKRQREEPDLTDSASDADAVGENDAQRRRVEESSSSNNGQEAEDTLASLKTSIYQEVTKSLEDSVSIDDVCVHVDDRSLVLQAIQSLEEDGKVMQSEGEVYLID